MRGMDARRPGQPWSAEPLSEMLADARIAEGYAVLRAMEDEAAACSQANGAELGILRARYTAARLRILVVKMVQAFGEGHLGSPFSIVEILYAVYFHALRIDSANPEDDHRDRFVLSKGHACAALYAVLADRGYLGVDELESYSQAGSRLPGHPTASAGPIPVPGIEISTGSLGNGLSPAVGFALAGKLQRDRFTSSR
jgi:transketolase